MELENTNNTCPKVAKCPIFQEGVLINKFTGDSYKKIYCTTLKHKECKRFLVSKIYNKPIPVQVLPNSFFSVDDIVKKLTDGYWNSKK